ncbi:MAG: hypothetical protein HYV28_14870, partial [Ignavibacteriales bacterium]|nr:hypothetical protein [Ignavibacteriales bacterium]
MKKFFLLVICSCLGLLHAQQAAVYFPTNNGFKWYFQNRPLDSLQQPVDSLKYFTIDSLAGEGTYLGVAAKYVLTKSGPAIGLQQMPYLDTTFLNFANTDGKEYFRVPNLDTIAAIMARYGLDTLLGGLSIINTFKSFEKWYTMYKFASSVNASYTVFTYDTAITIQTANVPLRFLLKGKRLADKSLTTQIGTFACKVFQMDFSMNYLLTIPPFPSIVVPLLTIPDTVYIAPANWQVRKVAPATTMNLSQLGYGSYNFPGLLSEIIPALPVFSSIAVLYPVGGSVVIPGSLCTVRWGSVNVGNVKIEYSTNNGASWLGIVNSVSASTGLYNWQVPLINSSECLIRITDADNQSVSGLSGVFQISGNSCKDVIVKAGWNLVSSPLKAINMNR